MLSTQVLCRLYNTWMDADMLETLYLFQPRGPNTAWLFRFTTPNILVGRTNPRTGKPYKRTIRESLGGTRSLVEARKLRDHRLGHIRAEEAQALAEQTGTNEDALEWAARLRDADPEKIVETFPTPNGDPDDEVIVSERDRVMDETVARAEEIERQSGELVARRWMKTAKGNATPLQTIYQKYLNNRAAGLAKSTQNNLKTAYDDFLSFAGKDIVIEEVDRRLVAEFVTEWLPKQKSPKAPDGPSPATIRKKVTLLSGVWKEARRRGYIDFDAPSPWAEQAPDKKTVRAAAMKRRIYTPDEIQKLRAACPAGDPLGDLLRVGLLTGVRLEELVSLRIEQVDEGARGYRIIEGKTTNAARYVPLVGEAKTIITRRMKAKGNDGRLFPELALRKSSGKYGAVLSTRFTRLRRSVLGEETDGELALHALRNTWRTNGGRAGVSESILQVMGGWSSEGPRQDDTYNEGLLKEQYIECQKQVHDYMKREGYLKDG